MEKSRMATRGKPPRPWDMDDLLDLGDKQGEKGTYLKAVPVLILETWVREGQEEGVANFEIVSNYVLA